MAAEIQEPVVYEELQVTETRQKKSGGRVFCLNWRPIVAIALFGAVCVGLGFGIAYAIVPRMGKYTKRNFPFQTSLTKDSIAASLWGI